MMRREYRVFPPEWDLERAYKRRKAQRRRRLRERTWFVRRLFWRGERP